MEGTTKQVSRQAGTVISLDRKRSIYSFLNAKYGKTKMITESFLRIEKSIANGTTNYDFSITKDTNSDTVTERKLDRKDMFHITHIGVFLMKRNSTKLGIEVLQTYPNPIVFPDDSTNFLGADLECFYNGSIQIKVGQTVYLEALDTRRFRAVEENIESSTITKSSAREYTGICELTPQLTLNGDQKTDVILTAPVASGAKVANTVANMTNYVVLFIRGFLITNK